MSCLPESVYAVYVDHELPLPEQREVEAHLIQCQRCRGLILALQDEAALLCDLLQQRAPATVQRSVPPRARARGLALGLVPTLGLGLLGATGAGWLLDRRLPGLTWMDPSTLIFGAYEMAFDTIFTLRDTLPVLVDLGIAVGATAAVAAMLTFFVSAVLRRVVAGTALMTLAALATTGVLLSAGPSQAVEIRSDERSIEVPRDEILEDTLVASGESVHIDGTVRGDVFSVAERVTIRGRVEGNVFAAGREVLVTGVVDGSLHMACERCDLEGSVTGNLYAAAEDLTVAEDASVGRDAHLFGAGIRMDGRAGRDVFAAGEWVELRGDVGRTVRTHSQRFTALEGARVGGDLLIEIPENGEAEVSPAASIGGEVSETVVQHRMHERSNRWLDGGFYMRAFVYLVSAFLVGMLLHALVPSLFWGTLETPGEFGRCLGYGFVALVVAPIALVLCALTVVGIPIAILGGFSYLTLLFVSTIVVAALVGSSITGADPESTYGFGLALLLGLVLVVAVMNLPFVAGLMRLLVGLAGMGLVITTVLEAWKNRRASSYA